MKRIKNIISDREFWFILIYNFFIFWGYDNGWLSMDTVVWIYFFQSIFIGLGNTVRMAFLKKFTTENFQINSEPAQPTTKTKWFSTVFFAVHYGFFHFGYFIFLIIMSAGNGSRVDFKLVLINIGIIAGNTLISTWSNILHDREEKPALSTMFFTPYLRVVPMHIFIIIGFTRQQNLEILISGLGMVNIFYIFLLLKIISDLLMHIIIQKSWRGIRAKPVGGYI